MLIKVKEKRAGDKGMNKIRGRKIDVFEAVHRADEGCSKLKGIEYIKCVKGKMKKEGLDEKSINEIIKSELLGFDL